MVYANRTGFTLDDVAADCLHPDQGRYGNAYTSEILRHWLWQAARRVRSVRSAPPAAGLAEEAWRLPPPCNATEPAALQGPEKVLRLQAELERSRGTVLLRTCAQESSAMYTVSHLTATTATGGGAIRGAASYILY